MVSYIISFMIISFSFVNNCYALGLGGRKILESKHEYINFNVTSFLSTSCKPSIQGDKKGSSRGPASLEVTHRYGYCSKTSLNLNNNNFPTLAEMIAQDQARVSSIQNRHTFNKGAAVDELGDSKATVPVNSGETFGLLAHVVTVGLGTPAKDLNLLMDTGSSLSWTQCQPCTGNCYSQKDPIFDPSASTSYSNSTCDSIQCSHLSNSEFYAQSCSAELTCVYGQRYGDGSSTRGYLGNERLTLTPHDVFDNFLFGCGEDNEGISDQSSGILGLGPDYFSLISQTATNYGKYFSYCLPTRSGSNGHLTLGNENGSPSNLVYTPLTIDPQGKHYTVNTVGISVGGTQLAIDPSVFNAGGTIIDSGTTFTYLPPTAYIALRDAFKQQMSQYNPTLPSSSDACYDISNNPTIKIPEISFIFAGNAKVDLALTQIFLSASPSQICLAFIPNNADTDTGFFGNLHQQTFEIAYDVAGGRLGFGPAGCS